MVIRKLPAPEPLRVAGVQIRQDAKARFFIKGRTIGSNARDLVYAIIDGIPDLCLEIPASLSSGGEIVIMNGKLFYFGVDAADDKPFLIEVPKWERFPSPFG